MITSLQWFWGVGISRQRGNTLLWATEKSTPTTKVMGGSWRRLPSSSFPKENQGWSCILVQCSNQFIVLMASWTGTVSLGERNLSNCCRQIPAASRLSYRMAAWRHPNRPEHTYLETVPRQVQLGVLCGSSAKAQEAQRVLLAPGAAHPCFSFQG